ncbi:hypothetical protein OPV22_003629 [Ensete ventricosum]|uniref:Uncharacterized protein n=1 Tax=Ensete ventricosum TaxID=4639 RepID=A0AAV8S151_ENSVE|nr:hypothetical protein OPV22_003629 [Ensete ventricosum]
MEHIGNSNVFCFLVDKEIGYGGTSHCTSQPGAVVSDTVNLSSSSTRPIRSMMRCSESTCSSTPVAFPCTCCGPSTLHVTEETSCYHGSLAGGSAVVTGTPSLVI